MKILINCSNQHQGGAIQVINSICLQLNRFPEHLFVVVLSREQESLCKTIDRFDNVKCYVHSMNDNVLSLLTGRNKYLDTLVEENEINIVFTVFGISRWKPKCPHLCGFARAQLLLRDSPYLKTVSLIERLKYLIQIYFFRRDAKYFFTENPYITELLPRILKKGSKVFTVTNYYNQIYENFDKWDLSFKLQPFVGTTILTIGIPYPHKNFGILPQIAHFLIKTKPEFKFRFVVTATKEDFSEMSEDLSSHFVFLGKIPFEACPYLYTQSDVMLMPSLMECFTATYPEAMKMKVPIVTVDLKYAHGLCGDAACYYESTNAKSAAYALYRVGTDKLYAKQLVEKGTCQLAKFDNYEQRTAKLIALLEEIYRMESVTQ